MFVFQHVCMKPWHVCKYMPVHVCEIYVNIYTPLPASFCPLRKNRRNRPLPCIFWRPQYPHSEAANCAPPVRLWVSMTCFLWTREKNERKCTNSSCERIRWRTEYLINIDLKILPFKRQVAQQFTHSTEKRRDAPGCNRNQSHKPLSLQKPSFSQKNCPRL